jgi:hypothetical protein
MYNYDPDKDTQSPPKNSDSDYTELLPDDFEQGCRRSARINQENVGIVTPNPNYQVNSNSLATGMSAWKEEQELLKDRLKAEIMSEINITNNKTSKNKKKDNNQSSGEKKWTPAHEEIWAMMESVRDYELYNAKGKEANNIIRNVSRHKIILEDKGPSHYINNIMIESLRYSSASI